ncbi:MAG: patatin-like phospholipase family protein [Bacteroidota bacterium]|nr:patatin-like phospholipase family protein [Bacteroidota bacterium]
MKQKVALVLSSGGARGMAHIGVIEELEKRGFEISSVAGSSIGAVVGGIYAAGYLDAYTKWMKGLQKLDVYKLMDFSISTQGFIKGEKVFEELKKIIPDINIEDMDIPYAALAADPRNRKEKVFKKGSLYKAMRASVAIPGVVLPGRINDLDLVDGGIVNPIPIDHVHREKDDILVVVDLNSSFSESQAKLPVIKNEPAQYQQILNKIKTRLGVSQKEFRVKQNKLSYYDILNNSINLMQEKLTELTIRIHNPEILVSIPRSSCRTFEFHKSDKMIEMGRKAFLKSCQKHSR